MSRKIAHVIGTGTIGEPLIGLLCDFKEELGIDEVTFHKNTPLTTDRSKVRSLISRSARLSTDEEKFDGFNAIGLKPDFNTCPGIAELKPIKPRNQLCFITDKVITLKPTPAVSDGTVFQKRIISATASS